jgi:potassium-transporting ATPase KdpC subunit
MFSQLRSAVLIFLILTVITGVAYPLAATLLAQAIFPHQANGSLIIEDGKIVGSELIGQPFDDPTYFWSRPSATTPAYNAAASTGSNYGPTNPAQHDALRGRIESLRKGQPSRSESVPVDLVTASASGLDPHISPAAALYQAHRVAKARGREMHTIEQLINKNTAGRQLGVLGEPRVNVLQLNLALDQLK